MMRFILLVVVGFTFCLKTATAAVQTVADFGDNGWYSWDTRSSSGTQLVGTNNTSPLWPATHVAADDALIEKQIIFLGEGQVADDAANNTPPPSPTGSLNGRGYVRLDGTSANSGKSDISYLNSAGIAPATDLTQSTFSTSYRYYAASNNQSRVVGLNIATIDPNDPTKVFTFNHVQSPYSANSWNLETVDNSSLFYLYGQGAPGGGASKTLVDWFSDAVWGPQLLDDTIFRVGFNIGSYQKNALIYMDWVQTSLLNGGDTIDFQAPAAVPEASSVVVWGMVTLLIGFGAVYMRRSSARV